MRILELASEDFMSSICVARALGGGGFSESSVDARVLVSWSSSLESAVVIGLVLS